MSPERTIAKSDPETARQRPAQATDGAVLGRLLDALIEEAPLLVRRKALLPAVDWRAATADQVLRLQNRLAHAGIKMPPWLARDLVVAGHVLPGDDVPALSEEMRMLSSLNALQAGAPMSAALRHAVMDAAARVSADSVLATAITRRLRDLGETSLAVQVALGRWPQVPEALRLMRQPLADEIARLPSLRVHLAGFSTTHFLTESLQPAFARVGRQVVVEEAGFGAAIASLLNPAVDMDAMFLLLDQESYFANDWRNGLKRERDGLDERLAVLAEAIETYAGRRGAPVFLNTLPAAAAPLMGHIDAVHEAGASSVAARVNRRLAAIAAAHPLVQLVDTDIALSDMPPERRFDAKLWYYGRMAYSDAAMARLADAFARAWKARARGPVKVVALDFDNTLWGGVYGDDGVARLACGDDFPGSAYKALQQECLRLKAQGVLLVALSKNNPDAIGVFAAHGGMVLRADDFVATAIDWQAKPDNLRRLAGELNLGLDSFLFLDDSPHEREAMRRMCPEVEVPEMPAHPELRPLWLRTLASTWPVRLTDEDAERSQMYAVQRKANELRQSTVSYDDYLRELDQSLFIEALDENNLARVVQLHERTNQFNLTTRRFAEAELAAFMGDEKNCIVLAGAAADRFGNHGIVITSVASIAGATATIESFLMSCRVIARQFETAFLGVFLERLVERGVEEVVGTFIPTAKNALVRDFYASNGFAPLAGEGSSERWIWRRATHAMPRTEHVRIQWRTE